MKITNLKRLIKEDFAEKDQDLVSKLAFSINPFLEQISNIFNKNIDFDNLNQELLSFEVTVDNNGKPALATELKYTLRTRPKGMQVIRAENISGTAGYPTGTPFITYDFNNENIRVLNVAGLPANKKFRLQVILIG